MSSIHAIEKVLGRGLPATRMGDWAGVDLFSPFLEDMTAHPAATEEGHAVADTGNSSISPSSPSGLPTVQTVVTAPAGPSDPQVRSAQQGSTSARGPSKAPDSVNARLVSTAREWLVRVRGGSGGTPVASGGSPPVASSGSQGVRALPLDLLLLPLPIGS